MPFDLSKLDDYIDKRKFDLSTLDNYIEEDEETKRKRKIVEEQNKIYDAWLANKGEKGIIPFLKDVGASAIPGLTGTADTIALIADLINPYTAVTKPLSRTVKPLTETSREYAKQLASEGQPEGWGKIAAQTIGGFAGSLPEMAVIAPTGPIGFAAHGTLKALESGENPVTAGLRSGTTGLAFELAKRLPGPIGKIAGSAAAFAGPTEAERIIEGEPITKPEETLANLGLGAALAAKGSMREKPLPKDVILDVIKNVPEEVSPTTKLIPPPEMIPSEQSVTSKLQPEVVPQANVPVETQPAKSKEGVILYETKTPTIPIEEEPIPVEHRFMEAIKSAPKLRGKQEQIISEEKARRIEKLKGVAKQTAGESGFYSELSTMKGEMPKVVFKSIRDKFSQEDVDALFDKIKNNQELSTWDKLPARKGLAKLLGEYGGTVPTENELSLLDTVFGKEFTKTVQEVRPFLKKMKDMGLQIANVPRSLMASFDLSAPFRQGMFFVSRGKQFVPAFKEMFSALGSEKGFKAISEDISKKPTFDLMKESGLALTEMDKLMSGREERFQSQLAERIPGIGKMVRASGRAYSGFLNKLRADVFDDLVRKAESQGLEPRKNMDLVKNIAHFVNAGTGRGSLGMGLERSATALNAFFFSPRLMASRLTLLNPKTYIGGDRFVRKEALKSLFGFATTAGTIMGLAKLAGAKVEDDPRSSDFAKIKIGNTRIDMLGGFQQYIRAAAQIGSGKYISSVTGKEVTLGEGYKPLTRYDIAMRQIESKEAPVASLITTLLRGQDRMGKPIEYSKEITDRFIPMIIADTVEIAKDNPDLIPAGLAGIFGFGIQTYSGKRGKKPKFNLSKLK